MKSKVFLLICVFICMFAMELEQKLEYKAEIEKLKTTCVALVQKECEINTLELRLKNHEDNQIGEELTKLERFCSSCRGAILRDQPYIKTGKNTFFHAICQAGFQGYECSYYPINKGPRIYDKYTQLELAILNVFEKAGKFINLSASYDYIVRRLSRDKIPTPNCLYRIVKDVLSPDLAHWRDNEHHWIMHRKYFGKPKDVKWERYIIEILSSRKVLPLVEFSYHPERGKLNVPPKLLNFIEKYTQCTTFQEALTKHVPQVEIFYWKEEPFIRLRTELTSERNFIFPVTQADSTSDACDSKRHFNHPFESSPAYQESSNILHAPTNQYQNYGKRLQYQSSFGTYSSKPSKKNNCSVHNEQPEETNNKSSPKATCAETLRFPWKWDEEYQAEF